MTAHPDDVFVAMAKADAKIEASAIDTETMDDFMSRRFIFPDRNVGPGESEFTCTGKAKYVFGVSERSLSTREVQSKDRGDWTMGATLEVKAR
jgi:hypothetical protein